MNQSINRLKEMVRRVDTLHIGLVVVAPDRTTGLTGVGSLDLDGGMMD